MGQKWQERRDAEAIVDMGVYRQRMRVAMLKGYPRTAIIAAARIAESPTATDRQRAAAAKLLQLPDARAFVGGQVPQEIQERAAQALEADPHVRLRRVYANMRQALDAGFSQRAAVHAASLLADPASLHEQRAAAAEVLSAGPPATTSATTPAITPATTPASASIITPISVHRPLPGQLPPGSATVCADGECR